MWYHQNELVTKLPDDCVGFVYCITNLTNDRKYIGKKLAMFSKTKIITVTLKNGAKKKKKVKLKVDSDWMTYYGSSDELNKDVELLGADNFKREILHYCINKGTCSYLELREQIDRRVLESDEYYNSYVGARIHRNHIKL